MAAKRIRLTLIMLVVFMVGCSKPKAAVLEAASPESGTGISANRTA
jgi:hypothetical protein